MTLEPIEEGDLDLKNKFVEKDLGEEKASEASVENVVAAPVEKKPERQEGVAEKDDAYAKIVSKIQTVSPQTDETQVKDDAHVIGQKVDAETRVKNLVDMAMQKGVEHAVKVARHIGDNYILDEFHDKLMADELHSALMEKGLIKDI
jgi:hypothetical protein